MSDKEKKETSVEIETDETVTTPTETENTDVTETENTVQPDENVDGGETAETGGADTVSEQRGIIGEGESAETDAVEAADEPEETDSEDNGGKKKKKKKKPLTKEQKKKRTIKALIITGAVVLVLAIFFSSCAIANAVGIKALIKAASSYDKVQYAENERFVKGENLVKDSDGYWTFETDRNLKIVQFTDVHIGAGCFSQSKDGWAMNAVAKMITEEKPDLVVVTGDIAYPVPFQAGTFNNLNATKVFANLMESLGVYWTFAFGNHDTEAYSMYERKDICEYYENAGFEYCLFERGFADDEKGYGNNIIKVQNSKGITTHAIVTLDSHSYIEGDYFGAAWKYDNIHQSQIDWYCAEMDKLKAANVAEGGDDEYVPNLAFFHIPMEEYRKAWGELIEANNGTKATDAEKKAGKYENIKETENVDYIYGIMGEDDKQKNGQRTYGVFCGIHPDEFFEKGADHGLQGTFCGHDHYNNFSVIYKQNGKRVRLTYGMSIDYLAYPGIYKEHLQRGCTVINLLADSEDEYGFNFTCEAKNYYTDYGVNHEKG